MRGRIGDSEWSEGSCVERVRMGVELTGCDEDWLDPDNNGVRIRYS